jgi:hypothetical protein
MAEGPSQRTSRESGEIATSTLAEIYAQQGLLGRALAIYRRIQARAPEDAEIAERIERLERRVAEAGTEPDAPIGASGTGIETTAPPPRERLPWDPPAVEAETPQPETAAPETAAPEMTDPAAEAEDPAAPTRVGPMDSGAFAAWLEGR